MDHFFLFFFDCKTMKGDVPLIKVRMKITSMWYLFFSYLQFFHTISPSILMRLQEGNNLFVSLIAMIFFFMYSHHSFIWYMTSFICFGRFNFFWDMTKFFWEFREECVVSLYKTMSQAIIGHNERIFSEGVVLYPLS